MRGRFAGTRLAAVAVLAATLAAPATAAECAAHEPLGDGWTRIAAPAFPAGPATITGYDVAERSVRDLAVTNGTAVATSTDGGCAWTVGDLGADRPLPAPDAAGGRVLGQHVAQVRFAPGVRPALWAIGRTDVVVEGAATTRPRVLVSTDRGRTFRSVTAGLPTFGRPVAVRGLPGGQAVLLFHEPARTPGYAIYRLRGATWEPVWTALRRLDDLAVDVLSPGAATGPAVWAWGSAGVFRGRVTADPVELAEVRAAAGNVRTVDLVPARGKRATVTVYYRGAAERSLSRDGGSTFVAEPAPLDVGSASTFAPVPSVRAVSSAERNVLVERLGVPGGVDLSPRGHTVGGVRFGSEVGPRGMPLYAFDPGALFLRWVPFGLVPPPLPPGEGGGVDVAVRPRAVRRPAARIEPRAPRVRLRPGERRTVDFTVRLPPVPTPLDVFFMTDSTTSMEATIASVQRGVQDIVDGLAATGADLRFGVADFRDYRAGADDHRNYPYKRRRPVGPVGPLLAEALESITTGGGNGGDGRNGGLEAIYQAATGAGRADPVVVGEHLVPPGQDARFRPEAVKVVLVATDDAFRHYDPRNPRMPVPSVETVAAALAGRGIRLVGLEVDTGSGSAYDDMAALARATGTVAPAAGVDCDGDGAPDLRVGDPLVCPFDPAAAGGIAEVFVALLAGVEERAPVRLAVQAGRGLARARTALTHPGVDVRAWHTFPLRVEFRCPAGAGGLVEPVRLSASSGGREVVATTATLECVPPRPPVDLPPVPPPVVVGGLVPPPPPPPAPPAQANPLLNPNVNPNPNPNPQLNGGSGFAAQEDEEVELAVAGNAVVLGDDELAMSRRDPVGPPLPALAWATALAMTGAAAFGWHRTRRTAPAHAPRERR